MALKKKTKKRKAPPKGMPMEFATLTMQVGMTINTGNYSSFRIDLGATVRHPEGRGYSRSEADTAVKRLETYLEEKVTEAVAAFREEEDE